MGKRVEAKTEMTAEMLYERYQKGERPSGANALAHGVASQGGKIATRNR